MNGTKTIFISFFLCLFFLKFISFSFAFPPNDDGATGVSVAVQVPSEEGEVDNCINKLEKLSGGQIAIYESVAILSGLVNYVSEGWGLSGIVWALGHILDWINKENIFYWRIACGAVIPAFATGRYLLLNLPSARRASLFSEEIQKCKTVLEVLSAIAKHPWSAARYIYDRKKID